MKKILLVSQYFWPETFRINDLALELIKLGYEVDVLTGKPNYPHGKIYENYGFFSHRKDNFHGVKIHRVPLIPRGNGNGVRLALNYLSYVFFSCLYILFCNRKYDVTLTFAISPITQAYPALLHKWKYKSKTLLWVQDLWPESVSAAGQVKSKTILNILNKLVKGIYRRVDSILVQSQAFIPSIEEKKIDNKKIRYVPNWAEDLFVNSASIDQNKFKNILPNGFIVMFTGNVGEAQDFESILKAASLTVHKKEIKWVVVGDGRKKAWVESEIMRLGLQDTVKLLGSYPVDDMPSFFTYADALLMSLKDEQVLALTIPSKLQSYMAFGKPIVGMLNGIGSDIISSAKCGYTASAADYEQLAKNILDLYSESKNTLEIMGNNAKKYYQEHFSKDVVLKDLLQIIEE